MKQEGKDTGWAWITNRTSGLKDSREVSLGDCHARFNSAKTHDRETIFFNGGYTCRNEWKKWKNRVLLWDIFVSNYGPGVGNHGMYYFNHVPKKEYAI